MRYVLHCHCGQVIVAAGAQAGTSIPCECGAEVSVPSLGKLRAFHQEVPAVASPAPSGTVKLHIGTIMIAIAVVAAQPALERRSVASAFALPMAMSAVATHGEMWRRCRDEGRPVSEEDRAAAVRFFLRVGLPFSGLVGVLRLLIPWLLVP